MRKQENREPPIRGLCLNHEEHIGTPTFRSGRWLLNTQTLPTSKIDSQFAIVRRMSISFVSPVWDDSEKISLWLLLPVSLAFVFLYNPSHRLSGLPTRILNHAHRVYAGYLFPAESGEPPRASGGRRAIVHDVLLAPHASLMMLRARGSSALPRL